MVTAKHARDWSDHDHVYDPHAPHRSCCRLHYAEAPVRQRAVLTCGSWRRVTRRIVCGLTCALTVSSLLMPSVSFAAEWVEVDGST